MSFMLKVRYRSLHRPRRTLNMNQTPLLVSSFKHGQRHKRRKTLSKKVFFRTFSGNPSKKHPPAKRNNLICSVSDVHEFQHIQSDIHYNLDTSAAGIYKKSSGKAVDMKRR